MVKVKRLNKKLKTKRTENIRVVIFSLPHLPVPAQIAPMGPQASQQSQILKLFWKTRNVGANLIFSGRMFQRVETTAEGSSPEPCQLNFFGRWDPKQVFSDGESGMGQFQFVGQKSFLCICLKGLALFACLVWPLQ